MHKGLFTPSYVKCSPYVSFFQRNCKTAEVGCRKPKEEVMQETPCLFMHMNFFTKRGLVLSVRFYFNLFIFLMERNGVKETGEMAAEK